jgi:WG containing repeat
MRYLIDEYDMKTLLSSIILCSLLTSCMSQKTSLLLVGDYGHGFEFINKKGEVVIPPSNDYDPIYNFSEGYAVVRFKQIKKSGFINSKGKQAFDSFFDGCKSFREGYAPVKIDGKWGYIDRNGRIVIEPQYAEAQHFNNGYASVKSKLVWGVIDKSGQFSIPCNYPNRLNYNREYLRAEIVSTTGLHGFIDVNGELIIDTAYKFTSHIVEGLIYVGNEHWHRGFIDINGDTVISFKYQDGEQFSEGLAPVLEIGDSCFHYIDQTDKIIIDKCFQHAWSFEDGLAIVMSGNKYGVINKKGKYVLPPIHPYLYYTRFGLFAITNGFGGTIRIINTDGKVVWVKD